MAEWSYLAALPPSTATMSFLSLSHVVSNIAPSD
jgi:hypothetical protein